ncbi:Murein hydrolase activator EnvC precursor [Pseudovibrio axinellae]|uniref:Murein hydrolase activator EnvC n=1 Tax=Pseudovibrio axinellae TaxID=989403 RepID=A0A165YYN6_9HYPH|nr:Murein hydrolase activator EnvC precursor [Pseudovibrio axinellae]SEQ40056.1 Septal ring factor EnvC, activator of murein hydrolases AmiA and AmiB [Pseudovibrio axinellae]
MRFRGNLILQLVTGIALFHAGVLSLPLHSTAQKLTNISFKIEDSDKADEDQAAATMREMRKQELRELNETISLSKEKREEIQRSIRALERDGESLSGELIRTGERIKKLENQLEATEARLSRHRKNEQSVRVSLNERKGVLAEVLSALQRIGHRPPPAMVVRPQDALGAVRSAILLNSIMPEVRIEAEALASDLTELSRLRGKIEAERNRIRSGAAQMAEERHRVELLLAKKRAARQERFVALEAEKARAKELADKATSLKELLANLEREVESSRRAAEAARLADIERQNQIASGDPFADPSRLKPAVAFSETLGLLPEPVSGTLLQDFGVADGFGKITTGQSIATRPNAQVTSPTDGWVVYAGAFRSYGQMVIVNAGGGHHVLLSGLGNVMVELGQFILAGEPIAEMGETRLASANNLNFSLDQPVLYVEFRKDGTAIDPNPWWSRAENEKVRG